MANDPNLNVRLLVEAIEDAGYEARSYSGRGMHGKTCLGAVCPKPITMVCNVISTFVSLAGNLDEVIGVADALAKGEIDDMGLEHIVYWPRIEWKGESSA